MKTQEEKGSNCYFIFNLILLLLLSSVVKLGRCFLDNEFLLQFAKAEQKTAISVYADDDRIEEEENWLFALSKKANENGIEISIPPLSAECQSDGINFVMSGIPLFINRTDSCSWLLSSEFDVVEDIELRLDSSVFVYQDGNMDATLWEVFSFRNGRSRKRRKIAVWNKKDAFFADLRRGSKWTRRSDLEGIELTNVFMQYVRIAEGKYDQEGNLIAVTGRFQASPTQRVDRLQTSSKPLINFRILCLYWPKGAISLTPLMSQSISSGAVKTRTDLGTA